MGSYWAYYELGWGGFWFWDPVENASFMPWLAGTALLHSAVVMEKRGALKVWTVLLAILTFSLSLLGTFLVRSGVLTSVHTFASDPTRGVFILAILTIFIGGALALFAWRAPEMKQGGLFAPLSREGALVFNNLFLVAACATVLVGTLYPLALEAFTGDKISVGAPFYNLTFVPLTIPLLLALPFGPLLGWKRGDLYGAAQRLGVAMGAALLAAVVTAIATGGKGVLAPLGLALGAWLIAGALTDLAERLLLFRTSFATSFARLRGLPLSALGTIVAHCGMGVCVVGLVSASAYSTETIAALKPGETMETGGYTLTFKGTAPTSGPNYNEERALFAVSRDGGRDFEMAPAKRSYQVRQMTTTEAAIKTLGFSQLYVSLGDRMDNGAQAVRATYKPLVTLIWLGALVMAFGGGLSLSDRRLRIGAPRRATARATGDAAA
jgi:cytochrome c-type biogenesis protein CcmF